jgi:hypothetical protein
MRKGTAIKAAIETTLRKTWSNFGRAPAHFAIRFAGHGACMSAAGNQLTITLPDFKDDHLYHDDHADKIVAMALHELGHGLFTDSELWDDFVRSQSKGRTDRLLHRCINAFEDVREEREIIKSGHAVGSDRLLRTLLQVMIKDCTAESFNNIENVPFAVCIDGRGYGVSVSHLQSKYAKIVAEGVARCADLQTTQDSCIAGAWLWQELKQAQQQEQQEQQQQQQQQQQGKQQGDGEGQQPSDQASGDDVLSVEPDVLGDLPLNDGVDDWDIRHYSPGHWETAKYEPVSPQPQTLGRLSYELRTLLDNSAHEQVDRRNRSGRLSRNWGAIARGEDNVFTRRSVEDGIDSAVFIAIDHSSSMRDQAGRVEHAAKSSLLLSDALKRCPGVRYKVASFSTGGAAQPAVTIDKHGNKNGGVSRASWRVYKDWNEQAGKFYERAASLFRTRDSTPEVAALLDVMADISKQPQQRKIVLWIGDGDAYTAEAIHAVLGRYPDVTVIAIGLGVDLSGYFKHAVQVNDSRELATTSFRAVSKILAA